MQNRDITTRTKEEIAEVTKNVILSIYFEFVSVQRLQSNWDAGMETINNIGRPNGRPKS